MLTYVSNMNHIFPNTNDEGEDGLHDERPQRMGVK